MLNIFNFFKKTKESFTDKIQVDIHSHLLPAIDDGAKDIESSILLIKKLQNLGYKKIITTPHIIIDSYPNNKNIIYSKLNIIKEELKKRDININIEAAAEHYLDEFFLDMLENNEVLTFNNYLLFETSYISKPLNLEDTICQINLKGYKAILAHPERYRYIKDLNFYKKLKNLGVFFQINLNSLSGYYGKEALKKANFLIDNGLVDFIGSDTHHLKHLNKLEETLLNETLWKKIESKNNILNKTLL